MTEVLRLATASGPLDAVVDVPGSKSIANRALVCAALADGDSRLRGLPGRRRHRRHARLPRRRSASGSRHRRRRCPRRRSSPARAVASTPSTSRSTPGWPARRRGSSPRWPRSPPGRSRSTGRHRCGAGRWGRCTTPSPTSAPPSCRRSAPAACRSRCRARCDDGGELALAGDVSSQYLTALMLDRPAARRWAGGPPDDAAGVGALRPPHGRGDGRVRRRRRDGRRRTASSCRRGATGGPS